MLATSASDPRLPFRFWKWVESVDAQACPVSPIASSVRQSPLSLPTNISSGLAAFHASACWNGAFCAQKPTVELVVLRQEQPMARLHFHRSFAPASSNVSCPDGTAASARL